ncbi:MAG: hypothetical protein R2699_15375 [Acidimicrobiales bacterium]
MGTGGGGGAHQGADVARVGDVDQHQHARSVGRRGGHRRQVVVGHRHGEHGWGVVVEATRATVPALHDERRGTTRLAVRSTSATSGASASTYTSTSAGPLRWTCHRLVRGCPPGRRAGRADTGGARAGAAVW